MTKQLGVIFIKRSGFEFIGSTSTSVIAYPFPPTLIAAQEVLDKEKTIESIGAFIQANKLVPIHLVILLSSEVLFEKYTKVQHPSPQPAPSVPAPSSTPPPTPPPQVIPPQQSEAAKKAAELQEALDEEKIVQQFLANIPFENIAAKKYKTANGSVIVATNNDLFATVKEAFEKGDFVVEAVVPTFVFDEKYHTLVNLTPEIAMNVEAKPDVAKQNNLLLNPEMIKSVQGGTEKGEQITPLVVPGSLRKNVRVFVLLGIFFILLVILGLVLYLSSRESIPAKKLPSRSLSSPTRSVSPSPTITTASSSAVLARTLTIVITRKAGDLGSANSLKTLLVGAGYLNTSVAPETNTSATNNTLLFSPTVPNSIREDIVTIVHKNFPETTITENTETTPDVTVIIGTK